MGKRLRSRGKEQDANGKIQMIRSNGTKKVIGKRDTEQKAICKKQKEVGKGKRQQARGKR